MSKRYGTTEYLSLHRYLSNTLSVSNIFTTEAHGFLYFFAAQWKLIMVFHVGILLKVERKALKKNKRIFRNMDEGVSKKSCSLLKGISNRFYAASIRLCSPGYLGTLYVD